MTVHDSLVKLWRTSPPLFNGRGREGGQRNKWLKQSDRLIILNQVRRRKFFDMRLRLRDVHTEVISNKYNVRLHTILLVCLVKSIQ